MLIYYISGHGYGHAVRDCEIIRQLPVELPVTIKTMVPETFLRAEIGDRPFAYIRAEYDCGVLGPDSSHADLEQTIARCEALEGLNAAQLDAEAAWLKEIGARIVVADIVPFALRAAHAAGVPSVLVANFTWPEIYADLLEHLQPPAALRARAQAAIATLQADFDAGTLLLETEFAIPMRACARRERIGLITRTGRNRRDELAALLALDPARPIYLLYLGKDGLAGVEWARLAEFDGQFIAYSIPPGAGAWVREVPQHALHHTDTAASVDAVIAKPGYVCAECMAAGTPLLYLPRPHFSEADAIAAALGRWGGAECIDLAAFRELAWAEPLARLRARRREIPQAAAPGGAQAVRAILNLIAPGTRQN